MAKDIQYVVDDKGRRKSAIMSYKAYQQLEEDSDNLRAKSERGGETPEDFGKVLQELKNAGGAPTSSAKPWTKTNC